MEEGLMVFDFWEQEENICLEQMKKSVETLKEVRDDLRKISQELDIAEKNLAIQKPKNEKNLSELPNSKPVIH